MAKLAFCTSKKIIWNWYAHCNALGVFLWEYKNGQCFYWACLCSRSWHIYRLTRTYYFKSKNLKDPTENYDWEYILINDPKTLNAWCMPGGKIAFYTGILEVTKDENGLAAVMGHEIAHAIALHGNERMSQGMAQQLGGVALSVAVANKSAETQNLFMTAYGIGSTVGGTLPFSRKQELEADQFGLRFAAMAGYNPQEAIPFWQRMAQASGGQKPPELLSTHPSDATRIQKMQTYVKEAMPYYKPLGK